MAKHGESEGDVLSREEMKSTKGGAGAAAAASEAGRKREALDQSLVDTSLQAEALNVMPTAEPVVRATPPPSPTPSVAKR
jgi:hypothetical protein